MATIDSRAILERIRAVIEANAGLLRAIDPERFEGGMWEDLDVEEQSKRATHRPIVEATITKNAPHEARGSVLCGVGLVAIEVTVLVTRHLGPQEKATDALRDAAKGLASDDADVIAQALGYPDNLDRATTGIVSGLLEWTGSEHEVSLGDAEAGRVITEHTFTGAVQTAPQTVPREFGPGFDGGFA